MRPTSALLSAALLLAAGCPPADPADDDAATDDDTADDDTGPDPCEGADATAELTDANNYAFDGALQVESTDLAELGDPLFDWGGLTTDLQGHDLDPVADIDLVSVVVFRYLTEEEVEQGLSTNTLDQADIGLFVAAEPGDTTSLRLSDLTIFGNDIDVEQYFTDGYGTWLLSLATGTTPGVGTRMAAFFSPVPGEPATTLALSDTSTVLEYTVDLQSLEPVAVPAATAALTVDWSAVATDGQGNPFAAADVDRLLVGHYASLDAAGLEAQFLDLELIATSLWEMDVSGASSADLSQAAGDTAFGGVDDTGTWVVALQCTTCPNPAPAVLTRLHACP